MAVKSTKFGHFLCIVEQHVVSCFVSRCQKWSCVARTISKSRALLEIWIEERR
jgi:hypothetical protein